MAWLKKIEFVIRKDGEEFDIRIKEKEFYSNEDRSDGFKRFIAILLILSIESRTQEAYSRLILFDEPDTFLYPTSAKFLKEELLEISEKAVVVYSTHSPFMIDNECIEETSSYRKKRRYFRNSPTRQITISRRRTFKKSDWKPYIWKYTVKKYYFWRIYGL